MEPGKRWRRRVDQADFFTTSTIAYGPRTFQVDFDFIDDTLRITTSDGGVATVALEPASIADLDAV